MLKFAYQIILIPAFEKLFFRVANFCIRKQFCSDELSSLLRSYHLIVHERYISILKKIVKGVIFVIVNSHSYTSYELTTKRNCSNTTVNLDNITNHLSAIASQFYRLQVDLKMQNGKQNGEVKIHSPIPKRIISGINVGGALYVQIPEKVMKTRENKHHTRCKSMESHCIVFPNHTSPVSHFALDIGGSLVKVAYFEAENSESKSKLFHIEMTKCQKKFKMVLELKE